MIRTTSDLTHVGDEIENLESFNAGPGNNAADVLVAASRYSIIGYFLLLAIAGFLNGCRDLIPVGIGSGYDFVPS